MENELVGGISGFALFVGVVVEHECFLVGRFEEW